MLETTCRLAASALFRGCRSAHSGRPKGKGRAADPATVVDLRSDTITLPTEAMRRAMAAAEVGNDIYGEDPTMIRLEAKMAEILGKQAGLYAFSGTMANLLASMAHCTGRGDEAIVGDKSHIFRYSQGCLAQIAGIQANCIPNLPDGTFDLDEMASRIQPDDFHCPRTGLIFIENTHGDMGGRVLPFEWLDKLRRISAKEGIPVHVDGARLLNAAVSAGVPPASLAGGFSSVSVCLSKGVGAPVGSVLAGDADFIARARRARKAIGGGGTQTGVLAAAGLVALEDAEERLAKDHKHAKDIAREVEAAHSKYVKASEADTQSNIIVLHTHCVSPEKLCSRLSRVTAPEEESLGFRVLVMAYPLTSSSVRLVTHSNHGTDDMDMAARKIGYVARNILLEDR